jgi:hypothetical protein
MARNYKKEYQNYQSTTKQKKRRAKRNAARRALMRAGKVRKGDGKDVAHKDNNPNNNTRSNWAVQSQHKNRSFARTKKAGMKRKK